MSESEIVKRDDSGAIVMADYGDDTGSGFEGQTQHDIAIPFINVLQAGSPQCKDGDEQFIDGARPGMLFNTVTEELIPALGEDQGMFFVVSHVDHCFTEWVPRDSGGGFVARHNLDSDVVRVAKESGAAINELQTEAGNDLVETYALWGIIHGEGRDPEFAILSCTSTKIGQYKKWNTKVTTMQVDNGTGKKVTPPRYAHNVVIRTWLNKSPKGDSYNIKIVPAQGTIAQSLMVPGDGLYEVAKKFKSTIEAGEVRADYDAASKRGGGTDPDADVF